MKPNALLRARPAEVNVEVGSNRRLPLDLFKKYQSTFGMTREPHRRVVANLRYILRPGKAMTGPPLGQDLTKFGIKPMDFCKIFNDKTKGVFKDDVDLISRIQIYEDKTYSWRIEPPPGSWYIMRCVRKKRRETNSSTWVCYVTLEMLFEIAKQKMRHWAVPDEPEIEIRVRNLIGQARGMGICVIGVDSPNSPVWGMTEKEYTKKCEEWRKIHRDQFFEEQRRSLLEAPLYQRLHNPDLSRLTPEEIQKGLRDPKLFRSLWNATNPSKTDNVQREQEEMALRYLRSKKWALHKDVPKEELVAMYQSKDLPQEYVKGMWEAKNPPKM